MRLAAAILPIIMLASCTKQEAMLSTEEQAQRDSLALQVAVMPVLNCLPVYYAARTGMADSAGLDIRLHRFQAQMDIDTALLHGRTDIATSDLIRAIRMKTDSSSVSVLKTVDEPMALVALKGKRVNKVRQLKEKMVAISRLCITDYWCDQMIDSIEVRHDDFYRPQVNDVRLRTDMLRTALMDAAILPEPYAEWMRLEGHKELHHTGDDSPRLAAWVMRTSLKDNTRKREQISLFMDLYDNAVEQLNAGVKPDTLANILTQEYGLPHQLTDTLKLPRLSKTSETRQSDVEVAEKWLKSRNVVRNVKDIVLQRQ